MKITINYADGVVNLPRSVTKSIKKATRHDLAALIALLSDPSLSPDAIAETAGITCEQLNSSISFWRGAGVISVDDTADQTQNVGEKEKKPRRMSRASVELTADDIDRIVTGSPERRSLLNECQQTVGHMFNNREAAIILGLKENLGLDDEYILLLTSFCVRRGKKTVGYIEKKAVELFERDIDTTEALEDYLSWYERNESLEGQLRRLFGWGERTIIKKERDFLERWGYVFGYGYEMIEAAYNVTVASIGKMSMAYMNSVLESWHNKGYRSPDEVEAGEGDRKKPSVSGSFDTDEFFRMAVARGISNDGKKQSGQ